MGNVTVIMLVFTTAYSFTALQLFHLILLSNLLYSTLVCVIVPVIVLMNWTTLVQGQLQSKAKHNYLLDIILFPSVFVIKLFLYLLERLYKTCLQFKATSKYCFVQHLWSLALKVFLPTVMVTCLLLYYSILFNIITTNQSLVVGNSVPFNFFNLAATVLLLSGESRGALPLFLDRTETHRAEKNVFGDDPSPPPYLKCLIHHCF